VQQIPPETSNFYMVVGYVVVVLILLGMLIYFVNRARRARAEIQLLEELECEEKPKRG
jgi:heme/copper-type cytochrome/quinol oxidase subunit 2